MPSIYVGTYAKYNDGNLHGARIDLEGMTEDAFFAKCAELHKDEADPELMFQDHEDIPAGMVSESSISDDLWDWLGLDDDERELLSTYRGYIGEAGTLEQAQESFAGRFESEEDWAAQYIDDCGLLKDAPSTLIQYFDFAAYARDARLGGDVTFVEVGYHDVWAFYNC